MEICNYNECTGCAACMNICPVSCISMKEDDYGELHPVIDTAKCIECGKCQRHCPNNVNLRYNKPIKVYAAVRKDKKELSRCASGGGGKLNNRCLL